MSSPVSDRRALLRATLATPLLLTGCGGKRPWHGIDVTGTSPSLAFSMQRVSDGREVTAATYRGDIVMLYLGYTFCPDVCPTTLANVAAVFKRLGKDADRIRFLFVTVDPGRDTLPVLRTYLANFGPHMVGLRGTPDQLVALARRFRLVYSVRPSPDPAKYEVTHSSAIYVFDAHGAARLLIPSLAAAHPDLAGTAADLRRLVGQGHPTGLVGQLLRTL
ncbi:MAG: SCO family protein [Rhodospirillales bacterium]|nr:SCO family protein [Rhodospirillales bacterium]